VGVFILPDNREPGMLETLCLAALAESPGGAGSLACTEEFLTCLRRSGTTAPDTSKVRLQAILAGLGAQDPRAGGGAREQLLPWDAAALAPLREFLERI
jgi:hypothetical protein